MEVTFTCVKICHATIMILIDWSGTTRCNRPNIPCSVVSVLPDTRCKTTAITMNGTTTARTVANAMPLVLLEHFTHLNPILGE